MGAQNGGWAQVLGREGHAVLLTHLNARHHFLALRPLIEVGAQTLDPIPGASILAYWGPVLAPISSKAREAFTGFSIPCPSIEAGH